MHICNNCQCFQTFRSAGSEEYLYAGNTIIFIEGFDSVSITVQTLRGPQEITLLETAFVPSFHTNIASLNRFIEKDVHWDTKEKKLVYKNLTVCSVEYHHRQWTLEYNEPDHHAFPAYSAQPKTTYEIMADIWHQRLGHPGPDALAYLSAATVGTKLKGPAIIECKTCAVTKAHEIISQQPTT